MYKKNKMENMFNLLSNRVTIVYITLKVYINQ